MKKTDKNQRWILINFPEILSPDQEELLNDFKIRVARACLNLLRSNNKGISVALLSSYPDIPNEIAVSVVLPHDVEMHHVSELGIATSKLLGEINSITLGLKSKLYLKEVRIGDIQDVPNTQQRYDEKNILLDATAQLPKWKFDEIILRDETVEELNRAISLFRFRELIFEKWGLKAIEPSPKVLINLFGPSGTGKTMAAHGIADSLNLPIVELSYAQVESKYVGEGPKNLRRAFDMARKSNALLFFDEADSLLGKRIRDLTEGSEQAINSMRSQLILEMDRYNGVAVFATNLIENYDFSFTNRLIHIRFELPNRELRKRLLERFLVVGLPGQNEVLWDNILNLTEGFSGRDLKETVIFAATEIAINQSFNLNDALSKAVNYIKVTKIHIAHSIPN